MKNIIILFIKGIIIGIGKVVPGVSGSMLAILMGVYDKGVYAISHFHENIKENFLFLLNVGLGIGVSITLGSGLILSLLNHYYFSTMLLFSGLIFGTIPSIIQSNIQKKKINYKTVIFVCFIFVFLSSYSMTGAYQFTFNFYNFLFMMFVGIIEAATMIIPGISGTAILMMLGVYSLLLEAYSHIFNISYFKYNFFLLFPFLIGFLIGFLLFTRIVDYMIQKHQKLAHDLILGFSLSSLLLLLIKTFKYPFTNMELGVGILLFIVGFLFSKIFDKI